MQRVLNRGIRCIYGLGMSEHIIPYRRELGWLRASGCRDCLAACMLHKLFARPSPSYLVDYYAVRTSDRPTRSAPGMLVVPSFHTESLRRSFYVSSSYFWNSLPPYILTASSISSFKRSIYNYIFTAEGVH